MKKKIFLNGFNAKLALTAIALTGVLLTGCYKDEGLDVITPSTTTLPAPQYTITGSVLDAETFLPVSGLTVTVNGTLATTQDGSYTIAAKGGATNTIEVSGNDNYEGTTSSIVIDKINAGQNVIYSRNILVRPTMNGNWKVIPSVTNMEGTPLTAGTDYTAKFFSVPGNQDVTGQINTLPAGSYNMVVTGLGKYANVNKTVSFNLAKVRTDNKTAEYVVNAYLNSASTPVNYTNVYGEIIYNGKVVLADIVKLTVNNTKFVSSNVAYYNFEVPNSLLTQTRATTTATLEITYKGETLPAINIIINDDPSSANQNDYNINTVTEDPEKPFLIASVATNGNPTNTDKTIVLSEITNTQQNEKNVSFNYTLKSGTQLVPANYMDQIAVAANIEVSSVAYNKIQAAISTAIIASYSEKEVTSSYMLPGRSILTPSIIYNNVSQNYKLTLTGSAAEGIKAAEGVEFGSFETKTVKESLYIQSIDHDHSHTHDNDLNAGGGIVEAE